MFQDKRWPLWARRAPQPPEVSSNLAPVHQHVSLFPDPARKSEKPMPLGRENKRSLRKGRKRNKGPQFIIPQSKDPHLGVNHTLWGR